MKMQTVLLVVVLALLLGCRKNDTSQARQQANDAGQQVAVSKLVVVNVSADTLAAITTLTRSLYRWIETVSTGEDFMPFKGGTLDTVYTGIDRNIHSKRMDELEATDMFSNMFLDHYDSIAMKIDKALSDGSSEWIIGDLPEFMANVDPWCDCQDYAFENYWDSISVVDVRVKTEGVYCKWDWSHEISNGYELGVRKYGNKWKIDYMEGFGPRHFYL